jgi:hypothetical protein
MKKYSAKGSLATLIKKKYSAIPSPNTFDIGKAAKRDSPAYKISFEERGLWTCGMLKISTAMKMLLHAAFSVQENLLACTLLSVPAFANVFFCVT